MEIEEIAKKYDLDFIVVFGSYGTDRYTENSDIDLAFERKKGLTVKEESDLFTDIMMCFKTGNIDLINAKKASILLKNEIAKEGRVLYEKENFFARFQSKVFKLFQEMRPMLQKRAEDISDEIKEMGKEIMN